MYIYILIYLVYLYTLTYLKLYLIHTSACIRIHNIHNIYTIFYKQINIYVIYNIHIPVYKPQALAGIE